MATYAAFKHVELFNVGKTKKRVLKPPGGGSSDIFGAANGGSTPSTPRSKNHMASNIFAAPQNRNGDSARKVSVDSHNRLFGEADRAQGVNKNQGNKSSLPFGSANTNNGGGDVSDSSAGSQVHTNGKSTNNGNGVSSIVHANGNGHTKTNGEVYLNGNGTKHDGNPVTGEGYRGGHDTNHHSAPLSNGNKPLINKNRVPPGGFSSGLW